MKLNSISLPASLLAFVTTLSAAAQTTPATQASGAKAQEAAAEKLPTAREIFDRAVAASGGADLIRTQTSRTQKGTIEMAAQSFKGTIITKSLAPDHLSVVTTMPGFGEIIQGINGTVGWTIEPARGPSLMTPEEATRAAREVSVEAELNPALGYDSVEVAGKSVFQDEPCFKVVLKQGERVSTRFYSQATGLQLGAMDTVETSMGKFDVVTKFKEFTNFSGRTLPKVQENSMMGQVQKLTIESIDFAPLKASDFVTPPEIQTLINSAKGGPSIPPIPAVPSSPSKK